METAILWLWPVVVLGSVVAVGLFVTNRDRKHHPHPGE